MRRTCTALFAAVAGVLGVWPAAAQTPVPAAVPIVVIDGKGFGHGVGMAQEGAFWMAKAGASTEAIFGEFYPGSGYGRGRGPVRVPLLDAGAAPTSGILAFPDGGEVREGGSGPVSPGFPVRIARGGQARLVFDGGRYRVESLSGGPVALGRTALIRSNRPQVPTIPGMTTTTTTPTIEPTSTTTSTTSTTSPPPPTTPSGASTTTTTAPSSATTTAPPPPADQPAPGGPPGQPPAGGGANGASAAPSSPRPLVSVPADNGSIALPARQRRYRGIIEATASSGTLRFVNAVDVETYLKGMGEVRDPNWPPAALRAQAIAARTYALRAMAGGGELCDTERCQVYLGAQAEYPAMNKAVDDSREKVLVFNGALISAVYSANGGGFSASREEGFGVLDDSVPYLRPAPYLTKDPGAWSVSVALTDVAARLGYAGQVTDVRISRLGPSQRALEVTLDGSAGPKVVNGRTFDAALGLRSTLFTLRLESGAASAPPPPDESVAVQAPPEEAAAIAATEVATAETPATSIRPRVPITATAPRGPSSDRRRQQALALASWFVTALIGAGVVFFTDGGWPSTRRRPSPSAPQTEDVSP